MSNLINKLKSTRAKYKYIAILALILVSWFFYNNFTNNKYSINNQSKNKTPLVSTEVIFPEEKSVKLSLTGVIDTRNNIELTAQTSGKVEFIKVEKGDFVKKDDIILLVEVNDKRANLEKAQALLKQRQIEHNSAESLNEAGYRSEFSLAASFAALKAAEADVEGAKIDLENCYVKSPFEGIIDTIYAKKGITINGATPILRLIECKNYIVKTNIPEKSIDKFQEKAAEITSPAFDHPIKGSVSGISMKSNKNTRSYEVEIKIPELQDKCMNIVGMTADVILDLYKTKSYLIPSYALSLSDEGSVGIKYLDSSNTVRFKSVEILEENEDGNFWVKTETDDKITLVAQGHTYVKVGEKVNVK
ncbi:MAG: efflux RND transporter periplasmic adaptor subunit [Rickettsiaceae bacterium H1]|nr:efflux RND transporter periplasmic adaptor subunit [Rickettsiaceae bacterium H1]